LLGKGSFGSVYKGILSDGTLVAVKVLQLQNDQVEKSFKVECKCLAKGSTSKSCENHNLMFQPPFQRFSVRVYV
jgi:hypothetical protein